MNTIRIILIIIVTYFLFFYYNSNCNNKSKDYENFSIKNDLVIARYNEDVDYLDKPYFKDFNIIIYNKGPKLDIDPNMAAVIDLPNVGREGHTYLFHIINNFNNLAPVTMFIPGSWQLPNKAGWTHEYLKILKQTNTTVLYTQANLRNIKNILYDFTLDEWLSTDDKNKELNPDKKLLISDIRPFGKWYEHHFSHINADDISVINYLGIFAADKKHIIQHPIELYQRLYDELNTHPNPEAGHYVERAWGTILYPYPEECINNY